MAPVPTPLGVEVTEPVVAVYPPRVAVMKCEVSPLVREGVPTFSFRFIWRKKQEKIKKSSASLSQLNSKLFLD